MEVITTPRRVPKKSSLRLWVDEQLQSGQSSGLVIRALETLSTVEDLVWYCDALSKKLLTFAPPAEERERWERWWLDRERLWFDLADSFSDVDLDGHRMSAVIRWLRLRLREWGRMTIENRKALLNEIPSDKWRESIGHAQSVAQESIEVALWEAYYRSETTEEIDTPCDLLPVFFLLKVDLPCYLEFGFTHDVILRQAVEEDDRQALERLFRLDPFARQLPGVAELTNGLILNNQGARIARIEKATQKPVTLQGQKLRTSLKAAVIGWLVDWSRQVHTGLKKSRAFTVPVLRELFDAKAKDCGRLRDGDLQADGGNLKQMVYRSRTLMSPQYWDIFRFSNVPMN